MAIELVGAKRMMLSRDDLLIMPLQTEDLPIARVEGWSTQQTWSGVRLADLAALVGSSSACGVLVESLEQGGPFRQASLSGDQLRARSRCWRFVNGADLSLDHGFPARAIVPANPGVHNTKWVRRLTFDDGD